MQPEYLLILLLNLALGTWLTAVSTAVTELSWGKIKKLDAQKKRHLISMAETLLEGRREHILALRLLSLANIVLFAILCYRQLYPFLMEATPAGIAISAAITTLSFLLVTEIAGNGLLASHPWSLLYVSHPPVRLIYFILFPLVQPTLWLQEHVHSLHELEDEEEKTTTADEIISLVEQDAHEEDEESDLEDSERRMIRGIFDLDETLVKEIMSPRVDVDALSIGSSVAEAKRLIVACGHSRIPIYRDSIDHIVGIVYAKDLLNDDRIGVDGQLDTFLHEPVFVPETKNIGDLLDEFKQSKKQIAVIIDEYGGTAGLVTIEDILEEIVGEIRDEYDMHEVEELYTIDAEGRVAADARTPIDEINELLNVNIPEDEDYDTIGGYISSKLGRIPRASEVIQLDNLEVQIIEADERKIARLNIRKLDLEEPVSENGRNGTK